MRNSPDDFFREWEIPSYELAEADQILADWRNNWPGHVSEMQEKIEELGDVKAIALYANAFEDFDKIPLVNLAVYGLYRYAKDTPTRGS